MEKKVKAMKRRQYLTGYLFLLPNFICFMTFVFVPIIMGLVISFTDYNGFNKFNFVGFSNYAAMFGDEYFRISLKNNIIYTLGTVPCTVVLALIIAAVLNGNVKGKNFLRTLYFFPNISSMVAVGIVWGMLFNPSKGLINGVLMSLGVANPPKWLASSQTALLSVMIVAVWKQVGYYMVILLSGMQSIPVSLYESAELDGANAVQRFFHVTIPLLSSTLFMVIILLIISSFQVFDLIAIMTEGGPGASTNVLVYRIYQEGFNYLRFGFASAEAYFLFLIICAITVVQFIGQRKWVTYLN
ncbi:MAG: sugar ABC transporter permease [Clostridiales bacterium]|nr:sugar ABC transporter permease [Clostridiales bacterium]